MPAKIRFGSGLFESVRSVIVSQSGVTVDGDLVAGSGDQKKIEVHILEGTLERLEMTAGTIHGSVSGNVNSDVVTIHGDVGGDVQADIVTCGNVGGDIEANIVTRR